MDKVYLVSEGSYSNYHIIGVFSTRELADKLAAHDKDREVEEWELDADAERVRVGLALYSAHMNEDGNDSNASAGEWEDDEKYYITAVRKDANGEPEPTLYCTVYATDKQHAIKIANEKRIELIATGKFDEWRESRRKEAILRVCYDNVNPPHYENCPACHGFGVNDDSDIPLTVYRARLIRTGGDVLTKHKPCQKCKSTIHGVPS